MKYSDAQVLEKARHYFTVQNIAFFFECFLEGNILSKHKTLDLSFLKFRVMLVPVLGLIA